MTCQLQHLGREHEDTLGLALASWAVQDQDAFLVSSEGHRLYTRRRLLALHSPARAPLLQSASPTGISLPSAPSAALSALLALLTTGAAPAGGPRREVLAAAACLGVSLALQEKAAGERDPLVANLAVFAARSNASSLSVLRTGPEAFEAQEQQSGLEADNRIACNFCPAKFKEKVYMRRHAQKVHANEMVSEKDVACGFCPGTFNVKYMHRHMQAKHPDEEASSNLAEDEFETATKEVLDVQLKPDVKVDCSHCTKTFASIDYLERHMKTKHPEQVQYPETKEISPKKEIVKDYQCDQCQKYLGSKNALKNHLPLHFIEKPFKCEICGKEFTQKGNMKIHVVRYHNGSENENTSSEDITMKMEMTDD
jgi:hypothetical protein